MASTPSRSRITLFTTPPLRSARRTSSASASLSSTNRISIASKSSIPLSPGWREREYRAVVHLAFGPHPSAVPGNHPMHDGESDARAAKLVGAVQALENAEELVRIIHIESDPVVPDRVLILRSDFATADFDARAGLFAAVFDGVGDQVGPYLAEQSRIPAGRGQRTDLDLRNAFGMIDLAERVRVEGLRDDLAYQRIDVDLMRGHRLATQPGKRQEVVDENAHAAAVLAYHGQIAPSLGVEPLVVVLLEHQCETVDGAQRCPQVVRDRVAETLELLVGGFELRGLALQLLVQFPNRMLGALAFGDVHRDSQQELRLSVRVENRQLHGVQCSDAEQPRVDGFLGDVHHAAGGDRLVISGHEMPGLVGRKEVAVGFADQVVPRYSEQRFARAVQPHELQILRVLDEYHEGYILYQRIQKAVARQQIGFGGLDLGDVARNRKQLLGLAVRAFDGHDDDVPPFRNSGPRRAAALESARAASERRGNGGARRLLVLAAPEGEPIAVRNRREILDVQQPHSLRRHLTQSRLGSQYGETIRGTVEDAAVVPIARPQSALGVGAGAHLAMDTAEQRREQRRCAP